jgi:P4 family phage/plasmid primase-like protien
MTDMLEASKALLSAGLSVIRVSTNGTKSPDVGPATGYKWAPYWDQPATVEQLNEWFGDGHPGIGIITGTISGNLEMLEFEGRAIAEGVHAEFFAALEDAGATELLRRIAGGYLESSPSGGLHLFYRIDGHVDGNTKLAEREASIEELTTEERDLLSTKGKRASRTLIETRGEHGFVVVAPSHGPVHRNGGSWDVVAGSVATIAHVTEDERDLIHACARSLDRIPLPEPIPDEHPRDPLMQDGDKTPGEDFNERATWREILEPHGWTLKRDTGIRQFWCRPGKREGNSAVTGGEQGDFFYAWTTSTELPAETTMSKWRVYAYLEHGADFKAAASALRRKGFGSPRREPERPADEWDFLPSLNEQAPALVVAESTPVTFTYVRSDDGNAQTLIEQYGNVIRFCPERGRWLAWQGTRWEWAEGPNGGLVREYAKKIGRSLPDNDAEAKKHKRYTLSAMGTTSMLVQAATDYRVAIRLSNLDAQPLELNTPGGIIDLTTGLLRPHDPRGLHTHITSCTPDYGANGAHWEGFLAETFAGHEELIPYIQRLAGYSASGVVGEHVLPFAYGPTGRNGKGVFLETIRAILGDYGTVAPNSFLMSQQFSKHEAEIAELVGTRMVLCSEVNVTDKFDEAKVKLLTGGDTLKARFLREGHFSFKPTHKLWLMGNDQPTVTAGGQAFWERLRIIPFDNTVARERRILGLQDIFAREHGPAILAWVIIGAVNYFTSGLSEPDSVRAATTGYAYAQDSVSQWIDECVYVSSSQDVKLSTAIARSNYEQWCKLEGESPVSPKRFGMIMKAHPGVGYTRSNGSRFYVGLSLTGEAGTDRALRYGEQGQLDD